ncbi:mCG148362 [Mus musculus]|jgi:hypothetical protein|nr:mCG148362 [Mus musculus]
MYLFYVLKQTGMFYTLKVPDIYKMHIKHIDPPQASYQTTQVVLFIHLRASCPFICLFLALILLRSMSAAHIHAAVWPSTGAWETY